MGVTEVGGYMLKCDFGGEAAQASAESEEAALRQAGYVMYREGHHGDLSVSDEARSGYVAVPDDEGFGFLDGKAACGWHALGIARQVREAREAARLS